MNEPVLNALFVTLGLALLCRLGELLPRAGRPSVRALLHGAMGLCALLTANAAGAPFGLGLGLNALTLPVSAGLGLPGVALLWALRYLL